MFDFSGSKNDTSKVTDGVEYTWQFYFQQKRGAYQIPKVT